MQTNVELSLFHDDKFLLREEDSDVNGFQYVPSMKFLYDGRRYHSDLSIGSSYQELIGSDLLPRENVTALWDQYWNFSTSTLGLQAEYSQRFVEEILELDDTAITSGSRVETVTFTPYFSAAISQRNNLGISYAYTYDSLQQSLGDVTVEGAGDNEQHDVNLWFERVLSPLSMFGLYGHYTLFTAEDGDDDGIDVYGISLGGSKQLSETWELSGSVGGSSVTTDSDPDSARVEFVGDGDTVFNSKLDLSYTGTINAFGVGIETGTNQQLDGVVEAQSSANLYWNRQFSANWTSYLQARHLSGDRRGRKNYFLQAQLEWQPSLRFQYRLSYRFRQQNADADEITGLDSFSGESNRLTLSVNYTFQDMRFDL